ncbi:MAG: hypothetical protein AAF556_06735 [Pseudomonadota bacterium]
MDKPTQAMPSTGIVLLFLALGLAFALLAPHPAWADSDAEELAEDLGRDMGGAIACGIERARILDLEQMHIEALRNTAESARDYVRAQDAYLELAEKTRRRGPREGCDAIRSRLESPELREVRELGNRVQSLEALSAQQLELLIKQQEMLQQQLEQQDQQ